MKKLTLLATAAWVGVAVADAPASSVTGFYTGVNLGLANTNVKYNLQNGQDGGVPASPTGLRIINTQAGKMGLQYGLFGGYNMGMGSGAVVGAEFFIGGDSSKTKPYDDTGSYASRAFGKAEVKRTLYYGLAPRVGFMVTPNVLAYVRLGIEGGKWKATYTVDPTAYTFNTNAGMNSTGLAQQTTNKNRINFAPGVGLDVFAAKNVFVRAQYHYVFGPKMKLVYNTSTGNNNAASQFAGNSLIQSFNVSQHVVSFAIGYKF